MLRWSTIFICLRTFFLVQGDTLIAKNYFTNFNKENFASGRCKNGLLPAIFESVSLPPDFDFANLFKSPSKVKKVTSKARSAMSSKTLDQSKILSSNEEPAYALANKIVFDAAYKHQTEAIENFARWITSTGINFMKSFKDENVTESQLKRRLQQGTPDTNALKPMQKFLLHFFSQEMKKFLAEFFNAKSPTLGSTEKIIISTDNSTITEALCATTEFAAKQENKDSAIDHACALQNALISYLTCGAFEHESSCNAQDRPMFYLPNRIESETIAFELEDIRDKETGMSPMSISQSTFEKEGKSYFYLFRSTMVSSLLTLEYYPCKYKDLEIFIPGWELAYMSTYKYQKSKYSKKRNVKEYTIFNLLRPKKSLPNNKCQYIISIRGTTNPREWMYNINFKMTSYISNTEKIHAGFSVLLKTIVNDAIRAFRDLDAFSSCKTVEVITTGYSLGGILSQLLAVSIAEIYTFAEVFAFSVGAPRGYNEEFLSRFRKTVNSRNIKNRYDPITELPCAIPSYTGIYYCDGKSYNEKNWYPYVKAPATYEFAPHDYFKQWGIDNNLLEIPLNSEESAQLKIPISAQAGANHFCAYACKFSNGLLGSAATLSNTWQCEVCQDKISPISFKLPITT